MRENRTYGSEGGDRLIICSLPLSNEDSSGAKQRHFCSRRPFTLPRKQLPDTKPVPRERHPPVTTTVARRLLAIAASVGS